MARLDGRVALVTGGQRGLGAAILREFAAEGAMCIVNYPTAADRAEADGLVRELQEMGVKAAAINADVANPRAVADLTANVHARFGSIDILVNNAGVNSLQKWEEIDDNTWERTLSVNLTGVFNCCKAVLPVMRRQKRGNIINIASIAAFIGRGNADYIGTKGAVIALTRSLARQYGKEGIRANTISPGFHNTLMTRRGQQGASENVDEFIKIVPLGFLAEADSIGKAALFLASDDSYYITGHNLVVDGGLTLR
jgi:3-oxoacyl-[acyl-carrier protein] reductase